MEEFFDIFLFLLLVVIVALIGGLIYLTIAAPQLAYLATIGIWVGIAGGLGFWIRHLIRKKRLGKYYSLFQEISRWQKTVQQTFRKLDPSLKRSFQSSRTKISRLCQHAKACIWKIHDIDRSLSALETKQLNMPISIGQEPAESIPKNQNLYYKNIRMIESSKKAYIEQVEQVLQFLHSLHAQLLTLRYTSSSADIHQEIAGTLDDLLAELQALEEISELPE
jgi:hypothetical protein